MSKVRFEEMVVEIQGTMYEVAFKKSHRGRICSRSDNTELEEYRSFSFSG
jgi:hypothetical protein